MSILKTIPGSILKCDMHVHSCYSGISKHLGFFQGADSFSLPEQIYARAKTNGMDIVTITDHDTINGCLHYLNAYPDTFDFFISEEVTASLNEFNTAIHINVYDINEKIHDEISRLKSDATGMVEYLKNEGICHCLNHPFLSLPKNKERWGGFFKYIYQRFDAIEVFNGCQARFQNELFLNGFFKNKAKLSGSDAHTLDRIGKTYTSAPGKNYREFLKNVFSGFAFAQGLHGTIPNVLYEFNKVYILYGLDCLKTGRMRINRFRFNQRMFRLICWVLLMPFFWIGSLAAVAHYFMRMVLFQKKKVVNFYTKKLPEILKPHGTINPDCLQDK